jgi:hypothetical protein
MLQHTNAAVRASNLIKRLLGIQDERGTRNTREADDSSAGYPLRRFAEFGLLPGYEFPTEPAALRLLSDEFEDDPVTTDRKWGIGQYQPNAPVFARAKRWKVVGLDTSSPWNPQGDAPSWEYMVCECCGLRHDSQQPRCPRCGNSDVNKKLPAFEYGGFVAIRNETPVMQEEDRFAARTLTHVHPQWDARVCLAWSVADAWPLQLRKNERVDWLNEGPVPTAAEVQAGNYLHDQATGYTPCHSCGAMLRPQRSGTGNGDPFGHRDNCARRGQPPSRLAIGTTSRLETLRLLIPVPSFPEGDEQSADDHKAFGRSLGESLLAGMRRYFVIGDREIEFELEGPWEERRNGTVFRALSLTFTDPTVGGSGYLERIAESFHEVAKAAIDHLRHTDCETACYRCLKSYANQRHHKLLEWPLAMPALEAIAQEAPLVQQPDRYAFDDPRPWLEAYAAGVGSPLELKFLHLFETHGFHPGKQVGIRVGSPTKQVSVADFAIGKLAIYVDGASVHIGRRSRRDRLVRDRIRNANEGWEVVELRASDLSRGQALVADLMARAHTP